MYGKPNHYVIKNSNYQRTPLDVQYDLKIYSTVCTMHLSALLQFPLTALLGSIDLFSWNYAPQFKITINMPALF